MPGSEDPVIEEYVVGSGAAIASVSRMVELLMVMPGVVKASVFMPGVQIASMPRAKAACCGESSGQGDRSKEGW